MSHPTARARRLSSLALAALFAVVPSVDAQTAQPAGKVPISTTSAEARADFVKGRKLAEDLRAHDSREFMLTAFLASPADGQQTRALRVDDLMALEQLGPTAVSPDGRWVAVTIVRPLTDAGTYRDFPFDNDRADVWLIPAGGGERRNITNGARDGSGYWNPVWSPDGKRLAMLSTKGGDNVRPYVYDLASGTMLRATERVADLQAHGDQGWPMYGMIWRDSTTLLCPVWAEGAPGASYVMSRIGSYAVAMQEWKKAEKGAEATASVQESGRELPEIERPRGALLAIDVVSGTARVAAEGNIRRVLVSPARRHVALIIETGRMLPRPGRKVSFGEGGPDGLNLVRTRLAILSLDRDSTARPVHGLLDPKIISEGPHSWSPDGTSLALVAREHRDDETPGMLALVSAATGASRRAGGKGLRVAAAAWSTGGDLLALARPPRSRIAGDADTVRLDWWAIDQRAAGGARKLTGQLGEVPPTLFRTPGRQTLVGVASGHLWSVDVRTGSADMVTQGLPDSLERVVWPNDVSGTNVQDLIVETRRTELYRVHWTSGKTGVTPFPRPTASASLAAFRPAQRLVVFTATERNGTFLWTGDGGPGQLEERIVLNRQLGQIEDAKRVLITYRGSEGDSLKGLVILPIGYRQGKRYPLITWVYGGLVVTDTLSSSWGPLLEKGFVSSLNLHLLPAHGYAVLIPSIPLSRAGDPWIDMPKGVIAAVDKAIDLGVADPEHLGVMGHSYGGYSAYALVTYTNRFKAAVARAAPANLASLYGSYSTPWRYDAYAYEDLFNVALAESGQARMAGPPWADPWRYVRNSPLFYAERVQTPLMIVQGDMDYVPIQQGEEFFTALYRQGKRAKFVRYWGEGHVISSPANVRDLWQRTYTWFDEHFRGARSGASD